MQMYADPCTRYAYPGTMVPGICEYIPGYMHPRIDDEFSIVAWISRKAEIPGTQYQGTPWNLGRWGRGMPGPLSSLVPWYPHTVTKTPENQ